MSLPGRCRFEIPACAESESPLLEVAQRIAPRASTTIAWCWRHRFASEASRPAAGSLTVDHLVNEYSVGSGMLIQRRKGVVFAVSDVSFEIGLGETFGLVGESAAENQRLVE